MKVRSSSTLGDYLREQRRNAELSLRQLADLAGVSNPYLSQIERGLRKPSAEVLQQLAKALRVSAEVLYVRAGLLDPAEEEGQDDRAVETAIRSDPYLSVRQKRVLLDIYSSFRREADEEEISEPERASTTRNRAVRHARQED
jgi:transcriptional regulator with XRE-family HTH domain